MNKAIAQNKEILPKSTVPQFTIYPYADDVFTDHERGKSFVVLHFRHDGAVLPRITDWIGKVMANIAPAGLVISGECEIKLTPRTQPAADQTQWKCLMKVPVKLLSEQTTDQQELMAAVRERFGR